MLHTEPDPSFAEYLTVGEAAKFLGVSPWTLRNWDRAGKFKTDRHPKNGYRIYRREVLESALQPDGGRADRTMPHGDWGDVGASGHFVQFYERDAYLINSVSRFIGAALEAGDGGIVIATPAHRNALQRKLRARGLDMLAARERGQYVAMDAADTLAQFMVGGSPDPARFAEVIGETITGVARGWPRVRAFGEMVALLWAAGNRDAAIRLEELWNEMGKAHSFALLCGYPIDHCGGEAQATSFGDVCKCHTRVVPTESYTKLLTEDERDRAISRLQQKARSLEAEIAHRAEVEKALRESEHLLADRTAEAEQRAKDLARSNAALEQFGAVIAHDLRQPLRTMKSYIKKLVECNQDPPDSQAADYIARAAHAADRMRTLIDDLLEYSRVDTQDTVLAPVDCAQALDTARANLQADIEESGATVTADDLPKVSVDRTQLAQLFQNLLGNALKFRGDQPPNVHVRARREADFWVIEVVDNGIGIEPEYLSRIFGLGNRLHSATKYPGNGIGLATCEKIVQRHGGRIWAVSPGPGLGSTFAFTLPE